MESKKEKIFPWIKDVLQSFASSFMLDYDIDVLSTLHRNIDKEINMIYSSNDQTIERTEALYKEITYIYEHMRLKISQHPECQNATLSCVKLISQLIRVGLILTQGLINSEWIERILTALELFPGEKVLVYDALFLVNGLKKIHQKPYCAILRHIMTEDHHEFVTDPLIYMEIILLFRRLKALVLNRYKEKYNILVTKIKPPSNLISWLASLDVNGYSPYLKKLKYKKIAQQLMKKALPESFIKKIRYMALNQYNFEIEDSELKVIETKNQPSSMFIIDNTSSTKCDNLDMLENSQKAITKKKTNSQAKRKRKKLLLNENIENDESPQSNRENETSNICINESGIDNNTHKHFSKSNKHTIVSKKKQKSNLSNSKERIIVSKKKKKSKSNLVKNPKSKTPTNLSDDVSDSDLFFEDVEGSTLLHDIDGSTLFHVNKSTLNKEDPESSSENKISILYINESDRNIASNKHSPNSIEHITVSKKKKKLKSKNTKSCTSVTLNNDESNSDLFYYDVENSSISEQLNKNTQNYKDPESSSEIKVSNVYIDNSDTDQTTHKHFPSSNEHIIVSKKKKKSKCNLIKNTDSEPSAVHSEDVPDSALFFHDVEGRSNSKKLKTTYNISNVPPKRDLSEDTDTLGKNVSKNKNHKKLKSSKHNETTISDNSISSNNKLDSNTVSHQQLLSENKNNEQENSFKDGEDIIFVTEISGKKRKKITSKDDSASDDKCIYFKKLMLQKVSDKSRTTSTEILNETENINSAVTVDDYAKLPDITEKNKNVTENNLCENQSVHLENVGVKNLEKENAIVNESLSVTENTVYENQTVCLKNIANKNFEEERNVICNIPSDHSDKFNDSIPPKNINNLSAEKESNLTVQSSEKTKLLIEPKIADESSTLGASTQTTEASTQTTEDSAQTTEDSTQTTEESDKNIVDNLNSEWIEEDNLVKNKQCNVLFLKSDISVASVSNVECKDVENKHNVKESRETLKSNQIANKESRASTEHPSAKDVSENIPVPSQNVDVKNNQNNTPEKDMHSNKYTFNITDCADLPITAKSIANQIQQISEPNAHICIAESNASIDSSSCENSIIAQHNENLNTFSVEKTLYSTTLDESSFKANLKSIDTQVSLEHENQKYISAIHDNIVPPTSPLDSMQSEGKSLLNDSHSKNVVNNEYSVENSSAVESESKLESKENSSENICSNEFDKAHLKKVDKSSTVIDEVSENNILHSIDQQDKSVQNMQTDVNTKLKLEKYIDTGNDVAGDSENCEYKTVCVETTPVSSEEQHVCFDSKKVEESYVFKENSLECESSKSLNIKEKLLITEVSTLDTQIKHDGLSTNLSIKTTVSDKEDNEIGPKLENVENANQKCVEKGTDFQATQKMLHPSEDKEVNDHVEDHAGHSVISIVKRQEEKSEKKDVQALDKLNDEKICSMLVNETYVYNNSVQLKRIDSQNDIISNENNERIVSTESILVSNELACLDTVSNSVNDVKTSVKEKEYTLQVIESEKVSDVCENSEKTSVANSQKDIVKDNKNSKRNLSNEITLSSNVSACSDNMCNSVTKDETSIKVELQSLLESKNVVITCENSDKLKVVSSQDDIIISNENNEKDLSNENIRSSNECFNKINNSLDDVKTLIEIMGSTIYSLPLIEKPIDACENSGVFKAVNSPDESILGNENCERDSSSENIPSPEESTSSDNIGNPENDVKIMESTVHLLPVIEKPIYAHENSDQLNSINSQNDSLIDIKNNERDLSNENISSLKESSNSDNIGNPENDVKIVESTAHLLPVIEKPIDAHENSDQLNSINSQNDSLIDIKNNERDLSNENISSLKESSNSDNIGNPENDVKIVESTAHLLPVIEKPIDAHENSDQLNSINSQNDSLIDIKNNERDLSNENISSLKESSNSDNIGNPENDVKIVESTAHLLPVIEKPIDAHENSDQLNSINSQNDSLIDIKNNERDLSNENISSLKEFSSSDNIGNPENDVKIVESTVHLLPVIEKPIDARENSDQLNSIKSQNDSLIDIKNNERDLSNENISSLKESSNSDNIGNPENDVKIVESTAHLLPVIEKPIDAHENSDQLNSINSQNDSLIDIKNNERDLSNENISSLKESSNSDNIGNPENDVKIVESTAHLLPVIEKPIDAHENSDQLNSINSQNDSLIDIKNNERDLSNENISSLKESSNSDNIGNPENDVKIVESTAHLLPVIEKPIDAHENSDQLNSINSQNDSLIDIKNNERDLSNENISSLKEFSSSDNIDNAANNVQIVESAIHLLPVIVQTVDACENSDQLKAVNSQNDTIIGNEKNLLIEDIPSSKECSDNINNSANDFKLHVEITKNTIHSVPVIEKHIVAYENSDKLKAVVNSQVDDVTSNEKDLLNENSSSSKECSDNINNSANDIKVPGEIAKNTIHSVPVIDKHIVAYENSDKLKAVNFQDDDVTSNEKDLLNENSSSSKEGSDNMNNSAADIKVCSEIMKNAIHSLPVIEKPTVACKNSDMLKVVNSQDGNENDLSNKNISSQKESTSSDNMHNSGNNIHNSENDVKISVELTNSTIPSLPLIEELVDTCENSYQLNVVNSQNDRIRDDENNEKDLSNENDVASSVKEKEDSFQLLESKNVEETPLNTENSSSRKIAIEVKNSNVCAKSNLNEHEKSCERMLKDNEREKSRERMLKDNEREKSCERMSKDNESDADCNFDLQERYIVLDESYSDVDDCKSNYSEQSNENSSPLKKFVTTTNKSKFKSPSSSDPSSKHVCENYNEQIEPVVKKNISEVSLLKSTNEMNSIESAIKIDATNKSEIKSDISSSDDNSNHLHEKDTSEVSHGNYTNDIDSTTSPVNAIATNESKFKGDIYSIEDCHKHLCVKDDHQIKPILKKDTSEISHENCASGTDSKNSCDSNLSNIKKSLSLIGNGIEHSLQDSNSREKVISVVQSQCSSSVLETESSKKEIKFAEIGEQSIKRMKGENIKYPSEVSESLSVPSFCGDENRESFTEISIKGKDKSLDIKSVGPVPVNRFPCDPSTEFFSAYKNKPANDKDNKTKSSLSSKDQSFIEIPFKDKDENIDIESVDSVPINHFSSAASTELCKNKLTNDENNKTKASLSLIDQSFTEIPIKDKDIDIETVGSVPINNFSPSTVASTESFGMYRNELTNDDDNKTEASLSSRDGILSNCPENDEIKSQTLSSDHSDDDCDSRCSSQEEEKESMSDDTVIPSEDCNDQSKTIDESLSFKNNVPSTAETENDSLDNKTCAKDKSLGGLNVSDSLDSTHEKNSVTSVLPRQSLRLKTKAESKCQTDSEEISTSDNSKIDEVSKKELKLVLTDCRSSLKSENNTNSLSVENILSCPLTHDNNEDITSSQTSVIKKNTSTAKDKSKESSTDSSKSAKRYSLRHRKSNQPRDDSANLGIDLNKLKFDSPKSTRSRRNSKYVQMLTSPSEDIKLQDNPSDVIPSKRETRSSAKADVGIEPNAASYNLRNRKAIIAPPKFNV